LANRYWVGGTASWDATAGAKWAAASGGAGGAAVPLATDDVFFDGIATGGGPAGAITVTVSAPAVCQNLNFTGFVGTFAGASTLAISGSFTWGAGMTRTYTGAMTFNAVAGVNGITSNGITFGSAITFNGVGGAWQLQDNFTSTALMTLTNGAFDTNAKTLQCTNWSSSNTNTRSLTITGSTWTLTGNTLSWGMSTTTGLTFNSSGSSLIFSNGTATANQFQAGALTYGDVTFAGSGSGMFSIVSGGVTTLRDLNITNTGGATFFFSAAITVRDFIFSGFTGTWSGTGPTSIGRHFTLAAGMTRLSTSALVFNATSGVSNITSNGISLAGSITFNGVGGTWRLQDALTTTQGLTLTNGTFQTNGQNVTTRNLATFNTNIRVLDVTNTLWVLTGLNVAVVNVSGANLTLISTGSTFRVDNTGSLVSETQTFSQGAQTFNDVQFIGTGAGGFNFNANPAGATFRDFTHTAPGTQLTIVGDNTFRNFTLANPPHTVVLGFGATQVVTGSLTMSGSPGNPLVIETNLSGSSARFIVEKNYVRCDYLQLKDVVASGGARWFAGKHSINNGGNRGWRFTDAAPRPPAMIRFGVE